jgi:hypothetical protein
LDPSQEYSFIIRKIYLVFLANFLHLLEGEVSSGISILCDGPSSDFNILSLEEFGDLARRKLYQFSNAAALASHKIVY